MPNHLAYKLPIDALDVVVIDDNQPMRHILQTILIAFGVGRIRTFPNGESALREMKAVPPNLVITDWNMKPVNGYQVLRTMRHENSKSLCLVPVIMLTAYASRDFVQKSFEAGVQQFLTKPVSPEALLKRIRWILKDERELILKNGYYVCSEDLGLQNEKSIRRRARTGILFAQKLANQSVKPEAANDAAPPACVPVKLAQGGKSENDLWEI